MTASIPCLTILVESTILMAALGRETMETLAPGLQRIPLGRYVIAHAVTSATTFGIFGLIAAPLKYMPLRTAALFEVAVTLPMSAALIFGTVAALRRV